jgi:hypothetical protein
MSTQPGHFLLANRKPNRTEPKLRFIRFSVAGSVMFFMVFGVRPRLRFYTETEPNNRTNRNIRYRPGTSLRHSFIAAHHVPLADPRPQSSRRPAPTPSAQAAGAAPARGSPVTRRRVAPDGRTRPPSRSLAESPPSRFTRKSQQRKP